MQVLINTSVLTNQNAGRGIGRYTKELFAALQNLHTDHAFLSSTESSVARIDLIHYPFFDLFFHTLPLFQKVPTVVTIHDVTPLVLAKHYPPGIKGAFRFFLQRIALRSVSAVITDSEISKRDIVEHLHYPAEKIAVVPLAASKALKRPQQAVIDVVRKKYGLPKNYVLYVGDINYNKNVPFLISSMKHFPKLHLALVGKNMKLTSIPEGRVIAETIAMTHMEDRVSLLTDVPADSLDELAALYAGATAYVQPSLYEGFGLPVLEAMQCRTPVISSRGGSLPEVAGEAALYFHPHDEDDFVAAMTTLLKMSDSAISSMTKAGEQQAAKFSWERTARATLAVYEQVMSK